MNGPNFYLIKRLLSLLAFKVGFKAVGRYAMTFGNINSIMKFPPIRKFKVLEFSTLTLTAVALKDVLLS